RFPPADKCFSSLSRRPKFLSQNFHLPAATCRALASIFTPKFHLPPSQPHVPSSFFFSPRRIAAASSFFSPRRRLQSPKPHRCRCRLPVVVFLSSSSSPICCPILAGAVVPSSSSLILAIQFSQQQGSHLSFI
ncbi:hypothetical protein ACLOJK_022967, partial [Asimina triloba]